MAGTARSPGILAQPIAENYVAFKSQFAALEVTNGAGRHINVDATLRIKCGRPHLKLEICTSGSVRGEGGNILTYSASA